MSDEGFRETGERLLRRRTIETAIGEGKTLSEIRVEVQEKSENQRELLKNLTEKVINPDPQYLKLTEYFYENLVDDFPEIVACGLAGSGALGGVQMRGEIGEIEGSDYDGFLIIKKGTVFSRIFDAQRRAEELLSELINNKDSLVEGLPDDFHFCKTLNYRQLYLTDLRDLSTDEIIQLLDEKPPKVLLQYFLPTYPEEIAQENRGKIFEALNSLSVPQWEYRANRLKDAWEENIITVKDKHILSRETNRWSYKTAVGEVAQAPQGRKTASLNRDVQLAKSVQREVVKTNRGLFNDLIDSTRPVAVE